MCVFYNNNMKATRPGSRNQRSINLAHVENQWEFSRAGETHRSYTQFVREAVGMQG